MTARRGRSGRAKPAREHGHLCPGRTNHRLGPCQHHRPHLGSVRGSLTNQP